MSWLLRGVWFVRVFALSLCLSLCASVRVFKHAGAVGTADAEIKDPPTPLWEPKMIKELFYSYRDIHKNDHLRPSFQQVIAFYVSERVIELYLQITSQRLSLDE